MIRHCVLLRFAAQVSDIDKDAIYQRLASLQSVVPGFERIVCGANSSVEHLAQGFDDGFVIDFVDASARDSYLAHPDHQRAGAALVAMLDGGHAGLVVFDLDDDGRRVPPAATSPRVGVELAVVGGGNMGAALLGGLLDAGAFDASSLAVVEVVESRRDQLTSMFPGVLVERAAPSCAGAVLAVKPGDIPAAAAAAAAAGATRVLSIAAGVRLATIQAAVGPGVAVIRAMPNTPALVRLGACAIAAGSTASDDDVAWAEQILRAVGTVDRVEEVALDAFTGVAGSGPAYVFFLAEALVDAAVDEGLDRTMAERVVRQLLLGSATLLDRDGDPRRLREMVTSPGGTTAAGIAALDEHDTRGAVAAAVRAATYRSRELG